MTENLTIPVYAQPAPPKPRRSRTSVVLIVVMALTIIALGVAWTMQRSETAKAVGVTAKYKDILADTRSELTAAQGDRDTFKENYYDTREESHAKDVQLAACALVVKISDHQYEQVMAALEAGQGYLTSSYGAASTKMDELSTHTDAIGALLDDNGYDTVTDLWETCSPSYTPI